MITSYSSFLPWMRMRVPGCEDNLILQALQASVRRLCMEAENYIIEQAPLDVTADDFVFTVTPPAFYDVLRIFDIRLKLTDSDEDPSSKGVTVDPRSYTYQDPGILEFDSPPSATDYDNSMYIRWVVTPQEDYNTFDWYYVTRWMDVIRDGALSYLYSLPERSWSSAELFEKHETEFIKGMSRGRRESYTWGTSRPIRIALRSFT